MSALDKEIKYLKGVGEQRAKAFAKLGIFTLRDLLCCFPRAYEDRTVILPIAEVPLEETACIRAIIASEPHLSRIRRGMELLKFRAADDSGLVDITYFNQGYLRNQLRLGEAYTFYGRVSGTLIHRTMSNPDFERSEREGEKTGCIMPRYRLCQGLSGNMMASCVKAALSYVGSDVPNALPDAVAERYSLAQARFAFENIHFPADMGSLELARGRLIFEELYVLACALGRMGTARGEKAGIKIARPSLDEFYSSLSFSPTGAQRRAIDDCMSDMSSGHGMSRLVQGDVGSGKTLVAAACAWAVCKSSCQAALMAPTEILAEQHFLTLTSLLSPLGVRLEKLTGSMSAKEKRLAKSRLSSGEAQLVIGTHALLSEDVSFKELALVITDEQHRFGVEQRGALTGKGEKPHVLVMSATPIPRTLALMIYGDLDVSVIDEMPPGRQKVDTFAVDEGYRERLNGFIEKLASQGRQIFVVCPMVEENDDFDPKLKNASDCAAELSKRFPKLRVACIHGRMKAKEKDAIMEDVVSGSIDVLVSTTVIEVGVDVPNAALMIVENAERFGLSQLHQLRGRVGRGKAKSYCVLVSGSESAESKERLAVMCRTNDGFKISEADLRLRGPGDFFGSRQHGLPEMHIADLCGDMSVLRRAQEAAQRTLQSDPALQSVENARLKKRIDELFTIREGSFN